MKSGSSDVAIIGGGIIGLSAALALSERFPWLSLTVLEASHRVATQQSGRNTGVVHTGIYCKPGTRMLRHCVEGREPLFRFCAEQGVPHERCGKLIVAVHDHQLHGFHQLVQRAQALGVRGRLLDASQIRDYEPLVAAKRGLHVPDSGIADFAQVARTFAALVRKRGGTIRTSSAVLAVRPSNGEMVLETAAGTVRAGLVMNCAGIHADRVARLCGLEPGVQIVPFQTVFHRLQAMNPRPIRNLVYTVPPPGVAYLGLHVVRTLAGPIEVVPNPSFVHKRQGYDRFNFALDDAIEMWRYRGFWRMVVCYGRASIRENAKLAGGGLQRAVETLLPGAGVEKVAWSRAGIHAQAVAANGEPVHDLHVVEAPRMIHVLNVPSPGATASLSIGRTLAEAAARQIGRPRTAVAVRTA